MEVRYGGRRAGTGGTATPAGVLSLGGVRALSACGGIPRSGAPAAAQPWDVHGGARRRGGAARSLAAVQDPDRADARRRGGQVRRRPAGTSPPLPGDPGLPRPLVELDVGLELRRQAPFMAGASP